MQGSEQSHNNNQETKPGAVPGPATNSLSFRRMFDRYYLGLCPPDPRDPEYVPPVNLEDRGQK